jgi:DNA-binding transcriptional LysR family regulator
MGRIDPRKLETFRVVVETKKISTAAKLLHLSQPAVTAQVRGLEEECGRALLVRSSKGVAPNGWGLRLLEVAKQVHGALGEVESAFDEEPASDEPVVIGASMTTAAYVVPPLVAGYRALHPGVPFRVQVANTPRVLDWVAEGRVGLGIVEGRLRSPRVRLERWLEDELVLVCANSAPASFRAVTRAADLANVPLLLREPGSNTRAVIEEALQKALGKHRMPRPEILFGSNQSIKMAAAAGLGVTFVSRWSIQNALASGLLRILPLRDLRIVRAFSLAALAPGVHGPAGKFLAWARRNPPKAP